MGLDATGDAAYISLMSNATRPDLSEVPASCPFVIIDASGAVAGWCETADGAARTCAEWGMGHTWTEVAS